MPFGHSEDLAEQERSVALNARSSPEQRQHSLDHAEIVRCFGRFPHRNALLGRTSSEEEPQFLAEGGFAG